MNHRLTCRGSLLTTLPAILLLLTTPLGPASMKVSGGVVSTVQLAWAGVGSGLSAASMAWTSRVWGPSARLLKLTGSEQAAKGAPSRAHS